MRVHVQDAGRAVTLTADHFVAAGGEGTVYARDGVAYKVFSDPDALDAARLDALRALRVPAAVLPGHDLHDDDGRLVGFTMAWLDGWWPLGRLLSRPFLEGHGVDHQGVLDLVLRLRDAVAAVHRAGALVVDLNEGNALVRPDFTDLKLIDTGSWQLPGFGATAILDTVRDRHAPVPSREADHFALAVLAFSLLVGIHPYRGLHPTLRSLDARMQARCSALDPSVRLPPGVWPTDALPRTWRDWLAAVLDGDHRGPPPRGPARIPWTPPAAPPEVGHLRRTRVLPWTSPPATVAGHAGSPRIGSSGALDLVRAADGTWLEARREPGGDLTLHRDDATPAVVPCDRWTTAGERLLVQVGRQLLEIAPRVLPASGGRALVLAPARRLATLHRTAELVDGAAVHRPGGAMHIGFSPGPGRWVQVRVPALDGRRPVALAHDRGVLAMVSPDDDGTLRRHVLRLDTAGAHDLRDAGPCDTADLRLVVLSTGVAVLAAGSVVELFRATPGDPAVKTVTVDLGPGPLQALDGALHQLAPAGLDRLELRATGSR